MMSAMNKPSATLTLLTLAFLTSAGCSTTGSGPAEIEPPVIEPAQVVPAAQPAPVAEEASKQEEGEVPIAVAESDLIVPPAAEFSTSGLRSYITRNQ